MNSGCAAALDRLQDFCFMAIKAANREPCTPPRSTLILTPAFVVYTELGIDPRKPVVSYSPGRSPAAFIDPGNSHSRGFQPLLAVPDAPPACGGRLRSHRAPPWPHLAKYNVAHCLVVALEKDTVDGKRKKTLDCYKSSRHKKQTPS